MTVSTDAEPLKQHVAPFHVDVHPERDVVRVVPVGELDLATARQLEPSCTSCAARASTTSCSTCAS